MRNVTMLLLPLYSYELMFKNIQSSTTLIFLQTIQARREFIKVYFQCGFLLELKLCLSVIFRVLLKKNSFSESSFTLQAV